MGVGEEPHLGFEYVPGQAPAVAVAATLAPAPAPALAPTLFPVQGRPHGMGFGGAGETEQQQAGVTGAS